MSGRSLRDELLALDAARARLDAEAARRLRAFDASLEWAAEGSRSAAAFLVTHTRCARGEAHHRVRVAREIAELEVTARAWSEGAVTTRHVEAIARARHAARANDAFAQFEPALVDLARAATPEDVANAAGQWRDALDADLDRDGSAAEEQHDRRAFDFPVRSTGWGSGPSRWTRSARSSSKRQCIRRMRSCIAPTTRVPRRNSVPMLWSRSAAPTWSTVRDAATCPRCWSWSTPRPSKATRSANVGSRAGIASRPRPPGG